MKQTFHIFLKDARQCWPYLAAVLGITIALALPGERNATGISMMNNPLDLVWVLLPVTWWVAIVRVIHSEGPVGDRQFWITRPYSWRSLIVAKVLFCFVFLLIPLLVHDMVILTAAGFAPLQMIPGLLMRYAALSAAMILPALVFAALTRNTREFVLACLAVALAGLVSGMIVGPTPPATASRALLEASRPGVLASIDNWWNTVVFGGGGVVLVLWQYARRQTSVARAIIVSAFLCSIGFSAWISRAVPPAVWEKAAFSDARNPELTVAFDRGRPGLAFRGNFNVPGKVLISVPIRFSGRHPDLFSYTLAAASIDGGQGNRLNASWNRDAWISGSSTEGISIDFGLTEKDFQRFGATPVKVRAVFGVTIYELEQDKPVILRSAAARLNNVPGLGIISMPDDVNNRVGLLAPLKSPGKKFIYTILNDDRNVLGSGQWAGAFPPSPDYLHISPVISITPGFQGSQPIGRIPKDVVLELTVARPVRIVRRDLAIDGIRLADYAQR